MITMNNRLFCFLFIILFFVSCSKSVTQDKEVDIEPIPEENVIPDTIVIEKFFFSLEKNSSIIQDQILAVGEDKFQGRLSTSFSKILIAEFKSNAKLVEVNGVRQISGVTANDFSKDITYTFIGERGTKKEVVVHIDWIQSQIPEITINIDGNAEVTSKETYLKANLKIDGGDLYPDFSGTTEIRGRGNSTWGYPKKPYRLKLTTKSSVLGLPTAKNWVLLANYIDPSLMCNSVAMRIGRDLEVPFTNSTIPVNLTINGEYRGSYVLTQHLEVADNKINVTNKGYLLEMDDYYDEEFKFKSANYQLPVMIKSPELALQSEVAPIQADFNEMESLVFASTFPNNGYRDKLDIDAFAKYILVYFLTGNEEVNHPKSTYMHKVPGNKFSFGPIWDFDWAYGFEASGNHFTNANRAFFWNSNNTAYQGTRFFTRLMQDPEVKALFKTYWSKYKSQHYQNLLKYIDDYAVTIKKSHEKDAVKWNSKKTLETQVVNLKSYLNSRSAYIDSYIASF